jgi:catechol O-methyltransferase
MPDGARLYSIEFSPANAEIARRILARAGVGEQVTVVVGTLGDGGNTITALEEEHGFSEGSLDFVFVDHDKDAYLSDLERILERGTWVRRATVNRVRRFDRRRVPAEFRGGCLRGIGSRSRNPEGGARCMQ